jgi:hypothetical protein
MKWYWAILVTIVVFAGMGAVLQVGGAPAEKLVHLALAVFGVWAAGTSGSVGWGLFVLFLWPIGFPCFLISQYRQPSAKVEGPDFLECPRCNTMIPPGEPKCPKCGWE